MRVCALVSGGKDSCFSMLECVRMGHRVVAIAHLRPPTTALSDEMDSFMYQTVGHQLVEAYARCLSVPLYQGYIHGTPKNTTITYDNAEDADEPNGAQPVVAHDDDVAHDVFDPEGVPQDADEVEDLTRLLRHVRRRVHFDGVASGAILSTYQRVRVENVCKRLRLVSLSYLWKQPQRRLIRQMIGAHVSAVLVKVAAMGLTPKHVGVGIDALLPLFERLRSEFGCNVCGEGGEYESFTLDCPLFRKRIVIDESEVVIHSDDAFAPVALLRVNAFHLEDKEESEILSQPLIEPPSEPVQSSVVLPESVDERLWRLSSREWKCSRLVCIDIGVTSSADEDDPLHSIGPFAFVSKVAVQQLEDCLKRNQCNGSHVIACNVTIRHMSHFKVFNDAYASLFRNAPPSRSCTSPVGARDPFALRLCALVCAPTAAGLSGPQRHHLHVQSVSHWAPSCIGPYSQSHGVASWITCSGQIPLLPSTMTLAPFCALKGDSSASAALDSMYRRSAALCWQHVTRVVTASVPTSSSYGSAGLQEPDTPDADETAAWLCGAQEEVCRHHVALAVSWVTHARGASAALSYPGPLPGCHVALLAHGLPRGAPLEVSAHSVARCRGDLFPNWRRVDDEVAELAFVRSNAIVMRNDDAPPAFLRTCDDHVADDGDESSATAVLIDGHSHVIDHSAVNALLITVTIAFPLDASSCDTSAIARQLHEALLTWWSRQRYDDFIGRNVHDTDVAQYVTQCCVYGQGAHDVHAEWASTAGDTRIDGDRILCLPVRAWYWEGDDDVTESSCMCIVTLYVE